MAASRADALEDKLRQREARVAFVEVALQDTRAASGRTEGELRAKVESVQNQLAAARRELDESQDRAQTLQNDLNTQATAVVRLRREKENAREEAEDYKAANEVLRRARAASPERGRSSGMHTEARDEVTRLQSALADRDAQLALLLRGVLTECASVPVATELGAPDAATSEQSSIPQADAAELAALRERVTELESSLARARSAAALEKVSTCQRSPDATREAAAAKHLARDPPVCWPTCQVLHQRDRS
jgi:hypothetical protein